MMMVQQANEAGAISLPCDGPELAAPNGLILKPCQAAN